MRLNEQDAAFRDEVRAFLQEALTDDLRTAGRRCSGIFSDYPDGIRWHRRLAARGWSVPHWPVAHGGTGWTPLQHYLFAAELAAADAPPLAPMGTGMVGPVIIAFGTPDQQARWLPGIRSGDDYWCQGYSEPQAGSDLAALQCRAVRDGEHYLINGTKIWTTHAQYANRMFCLVRTSAAGKPQAGISFLCFDLHTPGITVRPIVSISGDHELNQVFFDDVRVPASGLIGEENQGWTIAKYLLQHERGGAWAPQLRARLARLRRALAEAFAGQPADGAERQDLALALAEAQCRIDAVQALELRALQAQARGEPPGIRPSMGKLLGTELRQRLTEIGLEIAAHYGSVRVPMAASAEHEVPEQPVFAMSAYLNDRAASIYAGTNEVQRNLIAAHLLANGMNTAFALTDTQAMLRDSLVRWLADHWSDDIRARTLAASPAEPPLWRGLAHQLGVLGAGIDESLGGLGGGFIDQLVVMEALGASLAAEPYLSTVVIAGGVFRRERGPLARRLLARIACADAVIAFAGTEPLARHDPADVRTRLVADGSGYRLEGRKAVVTNAPWASDLLVSARSSGGPGDAHGVSLACIATDAPGMRRRDYRTVDGGVASEIEFDGVPVRADQLIGPPGEALPLLSQALDDATLAVCAEAVGVMRRLLRDTLDHVRERRQFGVPIASFQALQHRSADMHLALEQAAALTAAVAEQADDPPAQWAAAVSSAKVMASRACRVVGQGAVQLHGGMGMTEELALGHYFRRATQIEQTFGSVNWHLRRVERVRSDS